MKYNDSRNCTNNSNQSGHSGDRLFFKKILAKAVMEVPLLIKHLEDTESLPVGDSPHPPIILRFLPSPPG
jgi:hypothetical protein